MTIDLPTCERCEGMHPAERHLEVFPVNTLNEWMLASGQNMPNHSSSMAGRGKFVKVGRPETVIFRTKQEIYRICAYLKAMAPLLPDEDGAHTYEEVESAIHNA